MGVGNPWAGHVRVIMVSFLLATIKPCVFALNLGSDPPMGSEVEKNKQLINMLESGTHELKT